MAHGGTECTTNASGSASHQFEVETTPVVGKTTYPIDVGWGALGDLYGEFGVGDDFTGGIRYRWQVPSAVQDVASRITLSNDVPSKEPPALELEASPTRT